MQFNFGFPNLLDVPSVLLAYIEAKFAWWHHVMLWHKLSPPLVVCEHQPKLCDLITNNTEHLVNFGTIHCCTANANDFFREIVFLQIMMMPPNTEKTCLLKMDPNGQQLLVSQFQDYLVNGTFTDMSVCVVQDTVKYTIRCHRAVLASACPFLADLLRQDSDEETALGKDTR